MNIYEIGPMHICMQHCVYGINIYDICLSYMLYILYMIDI